MRGPICRSRPRMKSVRTMVGECPKAVPRTVDGPSPKPGRRGSRASALLAPQSSARLGGRPDGRFGSRRCNAGCGQPTARLFAAGREGGGRLEIVRGGYLIASEREWALWPTAGGASAEVRCSGRFHTFWAAVSCVSNAGEPDSARLFMPWARPHPLSIYELPLTTRPSSAHFATLWITPWHRARQRSSLESGEGGFAMGPGASGAPG